MSPTVPVARVAYWERIFYGGWVLPTFTALKGGTGAWRIAGYTEELEKGDGVPVPRLSETGISTCKQFAEHVATEDNISSITPQDLHARREKGELLSLLDVRLLDEYQAGHIPGAHFCPATQIALLVESLVGVKNAPIITMCAGRAQAILAASVLKGAGYPNVSVLDGGYYRLESIRV